MKPAHYGAMITLGFEDMWEPPVEEPCGFHDSFEEIFDFHDMLEAVNNDDE